MTKVLLIPKPVHSDSELGTMDPPVRRLAMVAQHACALGARMPLHDDRRFMYLVDEGEDVSIAVSRTFVEQLESAIAPVIETLSDGTGKVEAFDVSFHIHNCFRVKPRQQSSEQIDDHTLTLCVLAVAAALRELQKQKSLRRPASH